MKYETLLNYNYLLDEYFEGKRIDQFNEESLESLLAEYERLLKVEEALREVRYLIDNVGWVREESQSRKYVYSTALRDQLNKELCFSNRANAKKNTAKILCDQQELIKNAIYEKYGCNNEVCTKLTAIDRKYIDKFNAFWDNFKNQQ